jgi:K+-sensing histidine kinase KdpD
VKVLLDSLGGRWLRQLSPTRSVVAWVLAVGGPLLLTLAALPLHSEQVLGGFLFCMLLVVIAVAVIGGTWPALTGVVLGVAAREFLFASPFENPGADSMPDLISLVGFMFVGPAVAILICKLARLAEEQASSGRVEASLRRVATLVAQGAPADEPFAAVADEVGRLFQAGRTTMIRYESDGTATLVAGWSRASDGVPIGVQERLGGNNLVTIISQTRCPARIDDYADASGAAGVAARQVGFRSAVGAPIIVQGRLWRCHGRRLRR